MPEEIFEILDHLPTYVRYIFMYIHIYSRYKESVILKKISKRDD